MHNHRRHSGCRRLLSTALAAALLATASSALAVDDSQGEPHNNNPPWDPAAGVSPQSAFFSSAGVVFQNIFAIQQAGDVDHLILGCNQGNPAEPPRYVDTIKVGFVEGEGDLDMNVVTLSGSDYIALGHTASFWEYVRLPVNFGTVVLQVYGYNGSTGAYTLEYTCR